MRPVCLLRFLCALTLLLSAQAFALVGRLPFTEAGDFSEAAVVRGVAATREQCQLARHAVWADAGRDGAECLRYWVAGMGQAPVRRAVVYLHGDIFVGHGKTNPSYLNSSIATAQKDAEAWSKRLGAPYVFIGRPGTHGSSGDHMQRRRPAESALVSAALDVLKARHGIQEWVVAGQSGGGHLTSALLTRRSDIVCAVPTSAPSSPRIRWELMGRNKDTTGFTDSYEPHQHLSKGAMHERLRVFVLGDKSDRNVLWPSQVVMASALAQAGVPVEVLTGEGTGPDRHGLSNSARQVAGWCARDMDTREMLKQAARGLKG